MYERTRRERRRERRRKEAGAYLTAILWGLSAAGIIAVFIIVAAKTIQATEVSAAEATVTRASADSSGNALHGDGSMEEIADAAEAQEEDAEETDDAPTMIVIDPGHGGEDGGCSFGDITEKDINRMIANLVVYKLRNMGYTAVLSRRGDEYIDKAQRVEEANRNNALLYVSIHQNACEEDSSVSGIETWYDGSDTTRDNKRLAQLIHRETIKTTGAVDRQLMPDSDLCVTNKSEMPACLIETGFLSNAEEREKLNTGEYRNQIAEGIVRGIDLFLNPKTMYLTFDDGPSEENTDKVLDVLKERNIKATFFVIGEYVEKYPETARRIVEEGHTIGIHCNVHNYKKLYESADSYLEDFEQAYQTVLEVTGVEAKLFRFPGGSVNAYNKEVCEEIIEEMEERGFIYYDWNASLEDATGAEKAPDALIENAVSTTLGRQKIVMLAHDRVGNTALALDEMIDALPEYQMEALSEEVEPIQF